MIASGAIWSAEVHLPSHVGILSKRKPPFADRTSSGAGCRLRGPRRLETRKNSSWRKITILLIDPEKGEYRSKAEHIPHKSAAPIFAMARKSDILTRASRGPIGNLHGWICASRGCSVRV